jgi:hypothetical protein
MLAIQISHLKVGGQVHGLIPHLVDGGVYILQYADDTIIFMKHDLQTSLNMKLILFISKQLLRLKMKCHKSNIFILGKHDRGRMSIGFFLVVN